MGVSSLLSTLVFKWGLSVKLELTGWLEWLPRDPQVPNSTGVRPCPAFIKWVLGTHTQNFMLCGKHFIV